LHCDELNDCIIVCIKRKQEWILNRTLKNSITSAISCRLCAKQSDLEATRNLTITEKKDRAEPDGAILK